MNKLTDYPYLNWYVTNLRSIPKGTFLFGASTSQKIKGKRISVAPFRMGATPVTWGMWKEYLQSVSFPGKDINLPIDPGWGYPDDHPVVNVSWTDITISGGFCDWASKVSGQRLSLPTCVQWEYAARGGISGADYPWIDRFGHLIWSDFHRRHLWCSDTTLGDAGKTANVDRTNRIHRNEYGLTDMGGNVWQWCADYSPSAKEPADKFQNAYRSVRGGSWVNYLPVSFQVSFRNRECISDYRNNLSFRLVTEPK